MKRWLEIFLLFALTLTCRDGGAPAFGAENMRQTTETGEIKQNDGQASDEAKVQDFYLCAQGYEYTAPEHSSSSARLRGGGARRVLGSAKLFIKAGSIVNAVNPPGFTLELSSFVSGTLSSSAHFILLRRFRL